MEAGVPDIFESMCGGPSEEFRRKGLFLVVTVQMFKCLGVSKYTKRSERTEN